MSTGQRRAGSEGAARGLRLPDRLRLPDLLPWRRRGGAAEAGPLQTGPQAFAPAGGAIGPGIGTVSGIGAEQLSPADGVRGLPKPALRWVGPAGRIALREFDYAADSDAVAAFQHETYELNFPEFRYSSGFDAAFRHDLRRASLDSSHALFVLDAARIVGFLWVVVCENSWTNERYGYINNVFIERSQRGGGLARELISAGEDWFRQRGIRKARLTVTASNAEACRLYQSGGYEIARLEMDKRL